MSLQHVVVYPPLFPGTLGRFVVLASFLPVEGILFVLRYELPFAAGPPMYLVNFGICHVAGVPCVKS